MLVMNITGKGPGTEEPGGLHGERLSTYTQVSYSLLFSAIQQSESVIHKYRGSFLHSFPLFYHRMLDVFPCATQYDLTVYPFYK